MTDQQPKKQRHLDWEGCYNTRDLGGLPTMDGEVTNWGAVIRSDLPGRLTAQGRQALLDYGVRTIIDLRPSWEVQEAPSVFMESRGGTEGPTYLNLPLEKYYAHVSALIQKAQTPAEVYCIILDHYPDTVAEILRAIADAPPGGVLIHCHGGKDRTGIVSALLLRLAGVPDEAIAADYAVSQERLRPLFEKHAAGADDDEDGGFWARHSFAEPVMLELLTHVDTAHGGVRSYLEQAGLSPEEIELLKRRLRALLA
jgi:protein tyrosine/serine phosphatase